MNDKEVSDLLLLPILIGALGTIFYLIITYKKTSHSKDWNFSIKKIWALLELKRWKRKLAKINYSKFNDEETKSLKDYFDCDNIIFWGTGNEGVTLFVELNKRRDCLVEAIILLKTSDGSTYTLPNKNSCSFYNTSSNKWKAGDLTLTCCEPLKSWRLYFNGLLTKNGEENSYHHVRLNFIWKSASPPIAYPDDCSERILAESLASQPWKNPNWMHGITKLDVNGYEQYGSLIGTVDFSENDKNYQLHLPGLKRKQWGHYEAIKLNNSLSLMGRTSDGYAFWINKSSYKEWISNPTNSVVQYGSVRLPNNKILPIHSTNIEDLSLDGRKPPNAINITFSAGNKTFTAIIHLNNSKSSTYASNSWNQLIIPFDCGVNSSQGGGILTWWNRSKKLHHKTSPLGDLLVYSKLKDVNNSRICVAFSEREASCSDLVGAKGASLALLYSRRSNEYQVPNGFCLTSSALKCQIKANKLVEEIIGEIEAADENQLKNACEKAVNIFKETKIIGTIEIQLRNAFNNLKGSSDSGIETYAVRSSGIGEDSEDLSAAGQNSTILGCKNIEEILRRIQECWSSLYAYQSVQYRRQHGQQVNCGMGVVIQIMVNADSAGVMFSRHPNTGNPKEILITSNYGLGESVVSGHVEPDTIILENSFSGDLKIKEKTIGDKSHKIIVHANGTEVAKLNEEMKKACSVSDSQCLRLGKIALLQEKYWGAARDVEWAIVNDDIYLLQARPITNLNQWTEYELLHEFDTAIMSENDLLSFGNTGEVLPGAICPLSLSTTIVHLNDAIGIVSKTGFSEYHLNTLGVTHYHVGISIFETVLRNVEKEITTSNKIMDIAVFGRPITDERMFDIAHLRNGISNIVGKGQLFLNLIQCTWTSKKDAERSSELSKNLQINLDKCESSLEMYNEINKAIDTMKIIILSHNKTTSASVFSQIIFLSTILEGATNFSTDNYIDISSVLSSCNDVISAEIPEGLKKISDAIKKSGLSEEFVKVDCSETINWLQNNCPDVHQTLCQFLQKHGHRCIREFDFIEEPWGMNPTALMKSIQASVKSKHHSEEITSKSFTSVEDLIANLKSPTNNTTKKVLKFIIPLCRNSVIRREITKSAIILCIHKFRLAYIALGEQMVKEWRLPSKDLVFFMSHFEINKYLQSRDPSCLSKAILRKRYFKKWQTFLFPEMNYGVPKPLNFENDQNNTQIGAESKVVGSPVFSGQIVGRACVIKYFNEVEEIQSGDILITISTDIGWSPYFPLLGGVVTELGGLISHGAVVAREYGLPCIVGAQGATSMFKTGDSVILDATKGYVAKVKNEELN